MGNIWEFLLQTLTVSLTAAVLLIVKYLLADKLSPRWQYGIWGLLALRALTPAVRRTVHSTCPAVLTGSSSSMRRLSTSTPCWALSAWAICSLVIAP